MKWPKLLQVDPGREFMSALSQLLAKHGVEIRRGRVDTHRDLGVVERFSRTLAERLFGHQYAQEMRLPSGQRSTEWVKRLPAVVAALNGEVTKSTCKEPSDAIKAKTLRHGTQKLSSVVPGRPVSLEEQKVPSGVDVRFLYQPGELEGGRRRATDSLWSLEVHRLGRSVSKPGEPVLYYLQDGPPRGFVREELSFLRMGFSSAERCCSSFLVALETGQPDVIVDVARGVVEPVDTEQLGVGW